MLSFQLPFSDEPYDVIKSPTQPCLQRSGTCYRETDPDVSFSLEHDEDSRDSALGLDFQVNDYYEHSKYRNYSFNNQVHVCITIHNDTLKKMSMKV